MILLSVIHLPVTHRESQCIMRLYHIIIIIITMVLAERAGVEAGAGQGTQRYQDVHLFTADLVPRQLGGEASSVRRDRSHSHCHCRRGSQLPR